MFAAKDQWLSRTWPLVCNVQSWHLFSIERVLPNLDGSLTLNKNYRLFTNINNTAQTEGKLITEFQLFCLLTLVFFPPKSYHRVDSYLISKKITLQLLTLYSKPVNYWQALMKGSKIKNKYIVKKYSTKYPLYPSLHI